MMTNVFSIKGKKVEEIELPPYFNKEYRPDLIQRAVVSIQANRRQRYGTDKEAGLRTSADYFGNRRRTYRITINREMSRLPREKPGGGGLGKVRRVPQSVGGRTAHPPKAEKDYSKKINKREYMAALYSAIAATSNGDLVRKRGHLLGKEMQLPLVIEDEFSNINKTKEVLSVFGNIGLAQEIDSAKEKGKKSLLIVVDKDDKEVLRACKNLSGVDACSVDSINVELLAPGTHAGRLTLWTKSAIKNLETKKNKK